MKTANGEAFMVLQEGTIFGDYQIFYDIKSAMGYEVAKKNLLGQSHGEAATFMCCTEDVFEHLCYLYPKTAENLRQKSLERRAI